MLFFPKFPVGALFVVTDMIQLEPSEKSPAARTKQRESSVPTVPLVKNTIVVSTVL